MRLFVGIGIPEIIKRNILDLQSELKRYGIKGFWKHPENLHITIEFLGELGPSVIPALTNILAGAVGGRNSFQLTLSGLGGFPSLKRPHTLWTALGGNLPALYDLRDAVYFGLERNGLKLEDRPFKPHLTLASRPELNQADLSVFQAKVFGEFMVEELVLFESKVIRGERIYSDMFRAGLDVLP